MRSTDDSPKSFGVIRLCVDFTQLNRSVERERHPIPSVGHTLGLLQGEKVFSKLEEVPLSAESRLCTTFIIPIGRICFNRLPFGRTSAPEHFQRRLMHILELFEEMVSKRDQKGANVV